MMKPRLTNTELMVGAYIGDCRNVQSSVVRRAEPGHGADTDDTWSTNIEGAQGEQAVAKALGIYWQPIVGNLQADDAGPYQVRTNCSRKHTDTVIHKSDRDDRVYIGVLSFMPEFEIMGWIWGWEAKREEWYREGKKGRPKEYWVPITALHPMSELPTVAQLLAERAA